MMYPTDRHHRERIQAATNQQLSAARRAVGERSFRAFAELYLRHHFTLPPSPMHEELFKRLQTASTDRGIRLAIAAPRGHAKTTLSQAYILWCICYAKEPYIILISDTLDQASDQVSLIKDELEQNPLILSDFPEISVRPGLPKHEKAPRWRKDEIITRGPNGGVKVTALGADKKIRGRKHRNHRPSLIIIDDLENEASARSLEQRRNKEIWFTRSVVKAGTGTTNIVVLGTIMHYDALLTNLIDGQKSPGWTGLKYQAVQAWSDHRDLWEQWKRIFCRQEQHAGDDGPTGAEAFFEANQTAMLTGTDVLWPQRESYYELMTQRLVGGRYAFDAEKQNEPVNPGDCLFQESEFQFWDDEHSSLDKLLLFLGDRAAFYGACDPSLGKEGRHADDSAIVSIVRDSKTGVMYVIGAAIARRKPDRIIEDVIALNQLHRYSHFGIETNQFQQFLSDELRRRSEEAGVYIPIQDINHSTDKVGRIQKLQPMIGSGMLRLSRKHIDLLDQLRQFPYGAHDDGPDALEMAVDTGRCISPRCNADLRCHDVSKPYDPIEDERLWEDIDPDSEIGRYLGI